jgi:hypothetical protein
MAEKRSNKDQAVQPSGYSGENPATAGQGDTEVRSHTPENREGQINPSSPTHSTEGPSSNLGSATTSGGEGMGSMGYGGSDKPREMQQQVSPTTSSQKQSEAKQPQGSSTGKVPTDKHPGKEGGGNLRDEEDVA